MKPVFNPNEKSADPNEIVTRTRVTMPNSSGVKYFVYKGINKKDINELNPWPKK
jgi:hypothetical protein